jgi:Ca2+:H+ antiporter
MLLSSRLSLLLLLAPLALASHGLGWPGGLTFVLCALPLASLAERLGFVTEQLAAYTSDTLGGLLNATFGNATEVIIAAFAIRRRYLRLVKLTLLGSIVSNLLLVLGCAFLAGGAAGHAIQRFNRQGVAVNIGLLTLASVAVALPTLLSETQPEAPPLLAAPVEGGGDGRAAAARPSLGPELWLSRFESVLMLACYGLFLVFQLFTHRHLYEEEDPADVEAAAAIDRGRSVVGGGGSRISNANGEASFSGFATFSAANGGKHELEMGALGQQQQQQQRQQQQQQQRQQQEPNNHERASLLGGGGGGDGGVAASSGAAAAAGAAAATAAAAAAVFEPEEEDDPPPELALSSCLAWMALVTLAIAALSDAVTAAIAEAAAALRVPLPFLATIALPIVGNAAEHFSAVGFAARNRMEIALGVAVGSSTQVAVLVVPFCVCLAWAMGAPLDLNFYPFEAFVLFASVVLATVVVQDGTGNWLKGALLLISYLFVAGGFWVHRDQSLEEEGGVH